MDQNIVLNGNKLIAEFMGYEYIPWNGDDKPDKKPGWWKKDITKEKQDRESTLRKMGLSNFLVRKHTELRYYNEWSWLMPVVEKIESIYDDFHGYFAVHIVSNGCTISGTKLRPGVVNAYFDQEYADSKIKATYTCVVKFIKWYNENNKSNKS